MRAERAFDEQHGLDTSGIVRLHELAFENEHKELGARYEATSPESFERVMGQLELGDGELTFIDLGAGKGRVLLMASRFPFRRIVGVEFSPELTAIAERNVEGWRRRTPACPDIELVCQDATTYDFPDEPLLVYMYNPFDEPVMRAVLARLRASIERSPRPVLLVMISRLASLETVTSNGFEPATPSELFLPTAVGAH
jgi:SAM-dependent methyltransferase